MRLAVRFSPARGVRAGSQNTVAQGLIPELLKVHGDVVLFTATPEAFSGVRGLEIHPTMALGGARTAAGAILERVRDQLTFERDLRRHRCDVVYYPYTHEALLLTLRVPQVITVHDLIPVIYPEHFPLMSKQWRYFTFPALKRATAIITDASHTKQDLVRLGRIRPERVHVVPLGFRAKGSVATSTRRSEQRKYILYVSSSRYPYKNIPGLCEAFARIRDRVPHDLIVVGKSVPRFSAELERSIAALGIEGRVKLLEELTDDDLLDLYRNADLFVYPSRYEGFGIPPLEAMSHGVPVVASSAATIPEVCGNAAHYFDPESIDAIAGAIIAGLSDDELRRKLRANGAERVNMFRWEATAAAVVEVCRLSLRSGHTAA
jgi:glycosyltransferase involved in cell wall biosynthesis